MKRFIIITAILATCTLNAQDRTARPVRSTHPSGEETLDTLDTSDPGLKLILFTNGTWKFAKNYDTPATDSVMREDWAVNAIMPYRIVRDSLPYRITLMLADSTEAFCCPCEVPVYSKFGVRHGRNHNGVDLPSPTGTPTYSAFAGKVRTATRTKGYGNLVIIRHPNGLETYYGHLSRIDVQPEQWVSAGQQIGLIGSTGHSTGPHLHFESRYKGFAFDPQWIIDFENGVLRRDFFVLKKKYLSNYNRYTPESIEEEENILLDEEQERAEEERLRKEAEAMRWHTIKSGDTLSRIAVRNGTTVSAICKLNPGLTPKSTLKIGRKIRVR
ncbi:MAG: peptidoglycan DD-metalloendopeptidase family protein [Bacteroidales bacterium]|nr:peptidoglycan DD-metalloendopeptidase family protein [Bacteroidales bacterium]